jgi:hypothetical protein
MRITPEEVKAAYEKTGLRPMTEVFNGVMLDGTRCGCALTAVCIARGLADFDELEGLDDQLFDVGDAVFGALANCEEDREYLGQFIDGFDNYRDPDGASVAYMDGVEAARLIFDGGKDAAAETL